AYRTALEEYSCEQVPMAWATTQNNLGGALYVWALRQSKRSLLEQAEAAYRAAAGVFYKQQEKDGFDGATANALQVKKLLEQWKT
ncbi:MAG TPA: hypothetical protein VFQ99_04180, partial [Gallionella sp.]|nr:hypothetical protein [Gallionella sp.]